MPNLARATHGSDILERLTPDEKAYFIACTDIFHDSQYNVVGRPSSSTQLQNCVILNLSRTFTPSDFALTPSAKWDLNICSMPFITSQIMTNVIDTGFAVAQTAAPVACRWGGLTAFANNSGFATLPPSATGNCVSLNADTALFPEYRGTAEAGVTRKYYQVLSVGFECINSTPELYRSGTVIRYRVPTQGRPVPIALESTYPTAIRDSYRCYPAPPFTSSQATQYPDSVLDEAVKGAYCMHTLQDQVSDYYLSGNERVFISTPLAATDTGNAFISTSALGTTYDYDPPLVRGDLDMVGCYFTGLTPESVIQVRYRIVLSIVPSSSDSYLVSLAKMSPPANPDLDRLISLVQNDFLPGIPVGMNPKGEWWKVVLNGVAKIAPKVGMAVGMPKAGKVIGKAANVAPQIIEGVRKQQRNTQKNKKKPQPKAAPKGG